MSRWLFQKEYVDSTDPNYSVNELDSECFQTYLYVLGGNTSMDIEISTSDVFLGSINHFEMWNNPLHIYRQ